MNIPHILSEITNTPLFITPAKLAVILNLLDRKSGFQLGFDRHMLEGGPDLRAASVPMKRSPNEGGENIAVVQMLGSLVSRSSGFSDNSGLRSYRSMQYDIQQALNDDDIGGIIIDADSFGGTAAGCERLSRFIRQADEVKPIYGVVDLNCFSAGYYLAAACRKVILTDSTSAGVGSIGCISLFRSQVRKDEMDGYDYEVFTFGEKKADGNPHAPIDDRVRQAIQDNVWTYGTQFAQSVAEFRGLEIGAVIDTQAGLFYGPAAVDAGLADEIATFNEAVAMMAAEIDEQRKTTFTTGGSAMTTKDRIEKLLGNDDGVTALAELGYIKAEAAEEAVRETAVKEGHEAGRKQALEVARIAELGQVDAGVVVKMIQDDMDADRARETVQNLRATASSKQSIQSTISNDAGDGKHPLIAACESLAAR